MMGRPILLAGTLFLLMYVFPLPSWLSLSGHSGVSLAFALASKATAVDYTKATVSQSAHQVNRS